MVVGKQNNIVAAAALLSLWVLCNHNPLLCKCRSLVFVLNYSSWTIERFSCFSIVFSLSLSLVFPFYFIAR